MFRQGSPRDDRRRRALVEDALSSGGEASASIKPVRSRPARSAEVYSEMALRQHHWRMTDLIPRGRWGLAAWFVFGIATIALVEVCYWLAITRPMASAELPSALDLAARDSLASYISAMVLVGAAALSILIYAVRRHRTDDYRGRYRAWAWAALLWCVASIDTVADLRSLIRAVGVHLTDQMGPGDGVTWWLAPWLLALSFVALRAVLDLRASWLALGLFFSALACWTVGLVLDGTSVSLLGTVESAMFRRGLSMGGDWLLFCSWLAYGRYVLLEVHGQLPARRIKEKKEVRKRPRRDDVSGHEPVSAKPPAAEMRIDSPHAMPPTKATATSPAGAALKWATNSSSVGRSNGSGLAGGVKTTTSSAQPNQSRSQFVSGSQDDSQQDRTLSRAERKRLRREQRARERGN
jgi:hypothetical protein